MNTAIISPEDGPAENTQPVQECDPDELEAMRRKLYSTVDVGNQDKPELHAKLRLAAGLKAKERENLFIHVGKLVEIDQDTIVPLDTRDKTKGWFLENVECYKNVKNADGALEKRFGQEVHSADCGVLSSRVGPWRSHLWELKSVNSVPFLIPDGQVSIFVPSVATERGFFPSIGLYNVTNTGAPDMSGQRFTQEDAANSLEWIRQEIFGDYHFVSAADEANAVAAPLMLLTRYMHGGVLPLVIITAPESGTGKGHLSRTTETIVTPTACDTTALPTKDDEMGKTLGSILLTSQPVIRFDNAPRGQRIDNPVLCQFLTSPNFSFRRLGRNEMVSGFNDRLPVVDGCGIGPAGDMVRRTIVIRMDAKAEHPSLSGERIWRHEEGLHFWINEHRDEVLYHYLRLALAWCQAVRPQPQHAQKNDGFQDVIDVVSGILEYAGENRFWGNMEEVRRDAVDGSEKETGFNFCQWLYKELPNHEKFSSADVVERVHNIEGDSRFQVVNTPLPEQVHAKWDSGVAAKSAAVTAWIKGAQNQRFTVGSETYRVEMLDYKVGNKTQFSVLLEVSGDSAELDELVATIPR